MMNANMFATFSASAAYISAPTMLRSLSTMTFASAVRSFLSSREYELPYQIVCTSYSSLSSATYAGTPTVAILGIVYATAGTTG